MAIALAALAVVNIIVILYCYSLRKEIADLANAFIEFAGIQGDFVKMQEKTNITHRELIEDLRDGRRKEETRGKETD